MNLRARIPCLPTGILLIPFALCLFLLLSLPVLALGATTECADGIDNDSDGFIDLADSNCSSANDDDEWHPSACTDGIDNDGDGQIDADDSGCKEALRHGLEYSLAFDNSEKPECSDGINNDEDALADYPDDKSCSSADDDDEYEPRQCEDRVNNDDDTTKIDYIAPFRRGISRDNGCTSAYDDDEYNAVWCADGIDNDGDGFIDANDPGCTVNEKNRILRRENDERDQCDDGRDNDLDGYWDYPDDDGCSSKEDNDESTPSQCSDGRDNNGDGYTDYGNDLGCVSALFDNDERRQCSDSNDNDSDSKYDYIFLKKPPDSSCADGNDNDELEPRMCLDGIDNDGDGFIDYPNDIGCANIYDNDERNKCADGVDNDGDGETDYSFWGGDGECASSMDNDEFAESGGGGFFSLSPASHPFAILNFVGAETDAFSLLIASAREGLRNFLAKIADAAQPEAPTVTLAVGASDDDEVEIVTTEAYETWINIAWEATNACSCIGSKSPNNADWWTTGGGAVGEALFHSGDIVVTVADTPQIGYTLTCYGFHGSNCDLDESKYPAAIDTVTVTPMWNPWWQVAVDITGPAEAAVGDNVVLNYELYDIRECVATSPNGSWWSTAQNDEIKTDNIQPREGGGSIGVGTITEDTTFSLSCTGFDNGTYTDSITVRYVPPVPFFSITTASQSQTILVTLGTGAGTISNKAAVEVYAGGGFSGDVNLSSSGVPAGFTPRFSQSSIRCSGGASRCGTSDFWVEMTGSGQTEGFYPITIRATSGSEEKTTVINLRVRRFTPSFEEI